jgi:general secretion pathway protein B
MSFILEALKKSEREREAGDAPLSPGVPARSRRRSSSRRTPWPAVLTGLLLLGAVGAGWWLVARMAGEPVSEPPAAVVEPDVFPPVEERRPVDKAPTVPAPGHRISPHAEVAEPAKQPLPAVRVTAPVLEPAKSDPPAPRVEAPQTVTAKPGSADSSATLSAREMVADANASGDAALPPRLGRLPYDLQQAVRPLRLDVHVYDEDPAGRFVMINGQTFAQGADIKAGLVLERIAREGAVLSWKGQVFLLRAGD